jgi:poly-beta-1,6-N-acetyl-D-glucosamine synthase
MTAGNDVLMIVLFTVFCAAAAAQLFYYLWFYLAPFRYKDHPAAKSIKPVSVIICARNEAENLKKFLPSVLEQDYPNFEVIVVNDCSEDSTDEVLGALIPLYPRLRVSSITKDPKFAHSKKFAQFIGIKAAANDLLLFTDADCKPQSDKWLESMASNFNEGIEFVLGYGGYMSESGMLNKYIRFDSFFIAMQYLGMALRGIPYMGVGRNLAWSKPVFFRNKGFGNHTHLISGDDDLFVNSNARPDNTRVEFRTGSHTRSVPAKTFTAWFKQKQRHLTTGKYYRLRDKILLILEPLTRLLFYALFITLLINLYLWPWLLGVFVTRLICQATVFHLNSRKLEEPGITFPAIIFDFASPLLNLSLYLSTFRSGAGRTSWK